MTSEAQKKAGYLIPEQIDGHELLCVTMFIPNDLLYVAAFNAQLWDLGTWFTWEKSYQPGDTRASQAAAYWRYLLDTYLCVQFNKPKEDDGMPCCDDDELLGRFTSDGIWETSGDGGGTWTPNPDDDPRNTYIAAPPLGGSGDATKCAAADNARDQMLALRDQLITLLTAGTTIIAIIAGILAFLAVITGVSGAAIGISVLLMGAAAQLLTLTPEAVEDAIDAAALDAFRCIIYCNVNNDGTFSYIGWQNVLEDIDTQFSGFAETFFHSIVASLGYIGLGNIGTLGTTTATDCGDCDCQCVHETDVLIGNFIEISADGGGQYIKLSSELATHSGLTRQWAVVGGEAFCCTYHTFQVTEGAISSGGLFNCSGDPTTPGNPISIVEFYSDSGAFTIKYYID